MESYSTGSFRFPVSTIESLALLFFEIAHLWKKKKNSHTEFTLREDFLAAIKE